MCVRVSGVVLQRIESNKDVRLATQVLNRVRDTWKEHKTPSLFVWNNHFFNSALLTKAHLVSKGWERGMETLQVLTRAALALPFPQVG